MQIPPRAACSAMTANCSRSLKFTDAASRSAAGPDRVHPGGHGQGLVLEPQPARPGTPAGHELALEYRSERACPGRRRNAAASRHHDRPRRTPPARRSMPKPISRCAAASSSGSASNASSATSSARTSCILRAAGEGIYGVNAEGKTTFVNPAAERMLGWKAEELVGKRHAFDRAPHPSRRLALSRPRIARSTRPSATASCISVEQRGVLAQGRHVASASNTPRRRSATAASLVGAVIVFRDITPAPRGRRKAARRAPAEVEQSARAAGAGERLSAGGNPARRQSSRHHRRERARSRRRCSQIELVAPTDASGADHRRIRHRQGIDRARDPRGEPAAATGR